MFLFLSLPLLLNCSRPIACLEQVTQMKESLKKKKAVIFCLFTVVQAYIASLLSTLTLVPSLRFLCPLTFSTLFKSLPGTNGNGQKLHWLILLISCSVAASGDLKLREVTSHGTITQLAGGRAVLAPGSDSAELPSGQCGLCYFLVTQKVSFNVAAALPLLRRSWRRLFFYSFCSEVTKNNNPR